MADDALLQVRIDVAVRDRAAGVLEEMGLSIAEAVALMLTRTAEHGALPFAIDVEYDAWFRQQVEEARDDPRPALSSDEADALFASTRALLRDRIGRV